MSIQRPTHEVIAERAKAIQEEAEAYPVATRPRLLSIKKAALQALIDDYEGNTDVVASHYPGWEKEDLETLFGML